MASQKTFLVESGNPQFMGVRAGVVFHGGKGEATREQAEHLVADLGYTCAALSPEKDPALTDIKGLGKASAEKLTSAGVTTPQELIEADIEKLAEATQIVQGTLEAWQAAASELID